MSILDSCTIKALDVDSMRRSGNSLANTLYSDNTTILLFGELGAGKTTFVQGLAKGLGITAPITSPSFALEQRYGENFTHIDLYRLNPAQADEFLAHSEDCTGVRAIEWAERSSVLQAGIDVNIHDSGPEERTLDIHFHDMKVPSMSEIETWKHDVRLPRHIDEHMKAVTRVAIKMAQSLLKQGIIVRMQALEAAAELHDLLRFVDFSSFDGNENYLPTSKDKEVWTSLKERYGMPHEDAATRFLRERGYDGIATIIMTHRGMEQEGKESLQLKTTEQKILALADKRVRHDEIVTLDERFDDFIQRYGNGEEKPRIRQWRIRMKELEKELFPRGAPF